jgi:hypothetical protein
MTIDDLLQAIQPKPMTAEDVAHFEAIIDKAVEALITKSL